MMVSMNRGGALTLLFMILWVALLTLCFEMYLQFLVTSSSFSFSSSSSRRDKFSFAFAVAWVRNVGISLKRKLLGHNSRRLFSRVSSWVSTTISFSSSVMSMITLNVSIGQQRNSSGTQQQKKRKKKPKSSRSGFRSSSAHFSALCETDKRKGYSSNELTGAEKGCVLNIASDVCGNTKSNQERELLITSRKEAELEMSNAISAFKKAEESMKTARKSGLLDKNSEETSERTQSPQILSGSINENESETIRPQNRIEDDSKAINDASDEVSVKQELPFALKQKNKANVTDCLGHNTNLPKCEAPKPTKDNEAGPNQLYEELAEHSMHNEACQSEHDLTFEEAVARADAAKRRADANQKIIKEYLNAMRKKESPKKQRDSPVLKNYTQDNKSDAIKALEKKEAELQAMAKRESEVRAALAKKEAELNALTNQRLKASSRQ